MLKNYSIVPGSYVSPAVKWVNARQGGVMCTSPGYGDPGQAGGIGIYDDSEEDERM